MRLATNVDPRIRGMRPELRFGLMIADFTALVLSVYLATGVGNIHSAGPSQVFLLAALFFV